MTDYTDAACLGQDAELWFAQDRTYERMFALRTCNGAPARGARPAQPPCPIRESCLRDALKAESLADTGHTFGVFGGLTAKQRAAMVTLLCQRCHVVPRKSANARFCVACKQVRDGESNARRTAIRYAS